MPDAWYVAAAAGQPMSGLLHHLGAPPEWHVASGVRQPQQPRPDAQGWSLLLVGPFLDRYMSDAWVFQWEYTAAALAVLTLSCACAVGVNISQFACLGRFSAVSFQARPHWDALLAWKQSSAALARESRSAMMVTRDKGLQALLWQSWEASQKKLG